MRHDDDDGRMIKVFRVIGIAEDGLFKISKRMAHDNVGRFAFEMRLNG